MYTGNGVVTAQAKVNRRAYPRLRRQQRVRIKILAAPDTGEGRVRGKRFSCSGEDISVGGVQFKSRIPLPVNVELEMEIEFPSIDERFKHTGRVAWIREDGDKSSHHVGVFFTDTDPRVLNAWRRLVQALRES